MLTRLDRIFGWLLLVGALLHVYGSLAILLPGTEIQVWALSGGLAAGLIAVLNLLRTTRPDDRAIAWITLLGSLCWVAVALGFGAAIHHMLDVRVLWHAIAAFVLAGFSVRTLAGARAGA